MFRSLILFSAVSILLLVGYITMEKGSVTKFKEVMDIEKTFSDIKEEIEEKEDKQKTRIGLEKSKDIVESILKDAKSTIKEAINPAHEERIDNAKDEVEKIEEAEEDINVEKEVVEAPVFQVSVEKNSDKYVDNKSRQWELLEDTQEVLADVGKILK